jgi:hypothetical protein
MSADGVSPAPRAAASIAVIALALVGVVAVMFLPLLVIAALYDVPELAGQAGSEAGATVGIAVIVRATARRLFRSGAQNLLRASLGAFTRTTARTLTRRLTRIAVRQMAMLTLASVVRDIGAPAEDQPRPAQSNLAALALGFAGLFASFWAILALVGGEQAAAVLQGMPAWQGAALVATPLVLHAAVTGLVAPLCGVQALFRTQLDGLLLQGYFTGAASFLPLTTDVEYVGQERDKARTAASVLLAMLGLHLAVWAAGRALGWPPLEFAAAAILMYCFVFSFPLQPLEGSHVWRRSKLLWVAVWLPILVAFVNNIPEAFAAVL